MRRRLGKYLPIVLMALAVQILAPIAACWAAGIAGSDLLHAAVICRNDAAKTGSPADRTGGQSAYDGVCSLCAVHAGGSFDAPQTAVAMSYRQPLSVVWREAAPESPGSRAGLPAQARAPPSIF